MRSKRLLVTGSSGLIGSELCSYFAQNGWEVHGLDNNMRATFFGPAGDTQSNQRRLVDLYANFTHYQADIRDRNSTLELIEKIRPAAIVHAAAQPSHDLAAKFPFEDFDINAMGTLNLLEGTRRFAPDATFVYMSTNKVYGDAPNELPLLETELRWDYASASNYNGITESMRIDQSKHSLFGASKAAADVMVQEYGRYFGMKTCCLRGGCLTGPNQAAVELHGFLSYLIKCNAYGLSYTIYGYKGKQVRDNIHSFDVARLIELIIHSPKCGEVYNIGGGRSNSCSILEAFSLVEEISGQKMNYSYVDRAREGDHICYISNLSKVMSHYPTWSVTKKLPAIFAEIYEDWHRKACLSC